MWFSLRWCYIGGAHLVSSVCLGTLLGGFRQVASALQLRASLCTQPVLHGRTPLLTGSAGTSLPPTASLQHPRAAQLGEAKVVPKVTPRAPRQQRPCRQGQRAAKWATSVHTSRTRPKGRAHCEHQQRSWHCTPRPHLFMAAFSQCPLSSVNFRYLARMLTWCTSVCSRSPLLASSAWSRRGLRVMVGAILGSEGAACCCAARQELGACSRAAHVRREVGAGPRGSCPATYRLQRPSQTCPTWAGRSSPRPAS